MFHKCNALIKTVPTHYKCSIWSQKNKKISHPDIFGNYFIKSISFIQLTDYFVILNNNHYPLFVAFPMLIRKYVYFWGMKIIDLVVHLMEH